MNSSVPIPAVSFLFWIRMISRLLLFCIFAKFVSSAMIDSFYFSSLPSSCSTVKASIALLLGYLRDMILLRVVLLSLSRGPMRELDDPWCLLN
jgi:hypothetical protein